jgi:hypothetical protein
MIDDDTYIEMMIVATFRWWWWFIFSTTEVATATTTTTAIATSRYTANQDSSLKSKIISAVKIKFFIIIKNLRFTLTAGDVTTK